MNRFITYSIRDDQHYRRSINIYFYFVHTKLIKFPQVLFNCTVRLINCQVTINNNLM